MGGNLGGNVPSSFSEAIMEIDYVRVYEESFLSSYKTQLYGRHGYLSKSYRQ